MDTKPLNFALWGSDSGSQNPELIDECDTRAEAERLLTEYRMAFGRSWTIWITDNTWVNAGPSHGG